MLLRFIADYVSKPEVRERFARDPDAVFRQYEVTPEERAALGSEEQVARYLASELRQAMASTSGPAPLSWGVEDMTVDRVEPSSGPAGQQLGLKISGTNFNPRVRVSFNMPGGADQPASGVKFLDDRTLEVTMLFPDAGLYAVKVVDDAKPPHGGRKDRAFTAR